MGEDESCTGAAIPLPLPFKRCPTWAHEQWVGWQTVERMFTPLSGDELTEGELRMIRTTVIHLLEQAAIILNGVHEELMHRTPGA